MKSDVQRSQNVFEIVPVAGRCFVLQRLGRKVRITRIRHRERPAPSRAGTVAPFPARVR